MTTEGMQVPPETLINWNTLCPEQLRRALDARFEELSTASEERESMLEPHRISARVAAGDAAQPAAPAFGVDA